MDIFKHAHYIASFLPLEKRSSKVEKIKLKNLPYWVQESCEIYRITIDRFRIDLIVPSSVFSFDQITNLYAVLIKADEVPKLILADSMSTQLRGGLIRGHVPHIYRDEMIFAPFMGVAYKKIAEKYEKTNYKRIWGVALRLAVCYLLRPNFFDKQASLIKLEKDISSIGLVYSRMHLSRAFRQLVEADLVMTKGLGPNKRYVFNEREEVWERILSMDVETYNKKISEYYFPSQDYVFSGDSALAKISDLTEPKVTTIAMSIEKYNKWKKGKKTASVPFGDFGQPSLEIELWSGDPEVLKSKECINVVDLSLSIRDSQDSRVRIAVTELLEKINLKADLLWRTE
ncbi:MAG: hypothetical protein M9962_13890 [Oligoflexia bacterium]|nr:hypothetical protein [Oligoflexia bacterium]